MKLPELLKLLREKKPEVWFCTATPQNVSSDFCIDIAEKLGYDLWVKREINRAEYGWIWIIGKCGDCDFVVTSDDIFQSQREAYQSGLTEILKLHLGIKEE
jgi:hypothetical protein